MWLHEHAKHNRIECADDSIACFILSSARPAHASHHPHSISRQPNTHTHQIDQDCTNRSVRTPSLLAGTPSHARTAPAGPRPPNLTPTNTQTVQVKQTPKRSEEAKNVSAGVDRKRRTVPYMAKRERKQTAPNVGCKENPVGVRRSPRLRVRGAVT